MNTTITLSLQDIGLLLIGICLIIALIYLIILLKNLATAVKSTNKILTDVEVISEMAARRSKDADKLLDEAAETISTVYETMKGNQSTIKALTVIVNSFASLKNMFTKGDKDKTGSDE